MENIFYIQKVKKEWQSIYQKDESTISKAKTKREVIAKTIIFAKTIGNSKIIIQDKEGNPSEVRTVKRVSNGQSAA